MPSEDDSRLSGVSSQQWERAFAKCASNTDSRPHRSLASCNDVIEFVLSDLDEDEGGTFSDLVEGYGASETVKDVLEAFAVVRVGVDFPFSTHGDAVSIGISRFPGGTTVGRSWDSSYGDSGICFVIPHASERQVRSEARGALWRLQHGADWTDARYFGFENLKAHWPKRKSSKKPPTQKARTRADRPSRSKNRVTATKDSKRTSSATKKRR